MATVGVVGCGTIATAVIRGIGRCAAKSHVAKVVVNPRNAANAKSLAEEFPGWVTIAADSQAVLDAADIIFVGLHHKHAPEELPKLKFDVQRHCMISLMAVVPTATLATLCSLPIKDIYRANPLPSVSQHRGITLLYSGTPDGARVQLFTELFDALGRCLRVKSDEEIKILFSVGKWTGATRRAAQAETASCNSISIRTHSPTSFDLGPPPETQAPGHRPSTMAIIWPLRGTPALYAGFSPPPCPAPVCPPCPCAAFSPPPPDRVCHNARAAAARCPDCMMGPFYLQLKIIRDWLETKGIDPVVASEMVGWTFNGIAGDAKDLCSAVDERGAPSGFDELIAEQTPGGLNEKAIAMMGPTLERIYLEALDVTQGAKPKAKL